MNRQPADAEVLRVLHDVLERKNAEIRRERARAEAAEEDARNLRARLERIEGPQPEWVRME